LKGGVDMKKLYFALAFVLIFFGLVGALYEPGGQMAGSDEGDVRITGQEDPMMNSPGTGTKMALQKGEYTNEMGQTMRIQQEANQIRLQVGEHVANCENCNLTQEMIGNRTRIHAQMSNGNQAEIKVMPNVASEVAIERLRMNRCENCSIDLKEVGKGNATKMAYEVKTEAQARVLGIFKTKVDAQVEVDAETGEVIRTRKPWWAVLQDSE